MSPRRSRVHSSTDWGNLHITTHKPSKTGTAVRRLTDTEVTDLKAALSLHHLPLLTSGVVEVRGYLLEAGGSGRSGC